MRGLASHLLSDPETRRNLDFEVQALHVPGKHNQFADCLSRWHSDASARDTYYRLCSDFDQIFHYQDIDSSCFSFDVA